MEGLEKEQTKNLENNPAGEEMKKTDEAVKKSEEQEKLKKTEYSSKYQTSTCRKID